MSTESDYRDAGCFSGLLDKNTGVLAIRATQNGIGAMAEWRVRLAIGQKNEQDQTTFMDLVDGNGRGHRWGMTNPERDTWRVFAAGWCGAAKGRVRGYASRGTERIEGERDLFDVCIPNVTRTLKMGVFRITDVAGGHTFFVQNLQSITGKWPAAVHATYQFGDQVRTNLLHPAESLSLKRNTKGRAHNQAAGLTRGLTLSPHCVCAQGSGFGVNP